MNTTMPSCVLESPQDSVTASRGMPGILEFEYEGPRLMAREQTSQRESISIRVIGPESGTNYKVRFVGTKAGAFDLRDLLVAESGTLPADVPTLPIVVVSHLPPSHGTDLFDQGARSFSLEPYYFLSLWILGIAWAITPVFMLARRLLRRRKAMTTATAVQPPTVAERIRELVMNAATRKLTVDEKATLELLLIAIRRVELNLQGLQPSQAIRILREHPTAGELIRTVERWNHSPEHAERMSSQEIHDLILRSLPECSSVSIEEVPR